MTIRTLFGVGALLLAAPTFAQQPVTVRVAVAHADLDLSSRDGLAMLDRRVARAARAACGDASPTDLAGRIAINECRDEARASARVQRDLLVATARPLRFASGR